MATCKSCTGGYQRKFRPRSEKDGVVILAGWYDEVCRECKGNYLTEPASLADQLEEFAKIKKAEDEEIPF